MKTGKDGAVKLEKGEVRIGNFFVKDEDGTTPDARLKIQDISSVFTFRVWKMVPLGIWLSNILGMGKEGEATLRTYIGVMWSLFSVVPDEEFVKELMSSTRACLERHPEWYAAKRGDESEDAESLKAVEEMSQFESEVASLAEREAEESENPKEKE